MPILEHALTKDRNKRYQSAGEMLRDLQNLGISKQRISSVKRFVQLAESKQVGTIAMSVAAFVALASAFAIWWFAFNGKERALGPEWFEPGPAEQVTFNGKVDFAVISPDGSYLAYTSRGVLHLRDLTAKTEWQLPPYSEVTFGLTFAPASKSLYYVLHDQSEWGRLYNVDVRGGVPKTLVNDIDGPITFSPDSKHFAFVRWSEDNQVGTNKIIALDVNDIGIQREIVKKVGTRILDIAWSDKRDQIAAIVFNGGLHSSLRGSLFFYGPEGSPKSSIPAEPTIRSMESTVWIPGTNVLAFAGIADWRTNQQAGLYDVSSTSGEFRTFPSPPYVYKLSTTRKGDLLSAIQQTRTASFWIADKSSLDSAHRLVPADDIDSSSFDSFSWDGDDNLIFSSALPHSINLMRLHPSGQTEKLTHAQGCAEREPAYVPNTSLVVYVSNCATLGNARNLWQLDLKTGRSEPLTAGLTRDSGPDVSRDGKWIAYTAWPAVVPSLWKLPVGGGTPQKFSRVQAWQPSISPDGQTALAMIRESYDGRVRYAILSLSNGNIERELWDIPTSNVGARWELDGQAIDFLDAEGTRLWRKPIIGGPMTPLTARTADPITDFSWNQRGNKMAFTTVHTNYDVVFIRRKAR